MRWLATHVQGLTKLCRLPRVSVLSGNYAPTPTHHFIKLLHDKGLLLRCFTQNIDSLEHQVRGCRVLVLQRWRLPDQQGPAAVSAHAHTSPMVRAEHIDAASCWQKSSAGANWKKQAHTLLASSATIVCCLLGIAGWAATSSGCGGARQL